MTYSIRNSEPVKQLVEQFQLQPGFVSPQGGTTIVPVMETHSKLVRNPDIVRHVAPTATGTNTILAAVASKVFVLKTATLSFSKDSTCDIATGTITLSGTVDGGTRHILALPVITLTAERDVVNQVWPAGLELDSNSALTVTGTFTLGVCVRASNITGYYK